MSVQFGIGTLVASGQSFGFLQGVTVDFSFDEATLYSGSGLYPVDVRVHTATITGSSQYADVDIESLKKILNGTVAGSVMTVTNSTIPNFFQLVFTVTTDGVSFIITLVRARASSLSLSFERTAHLIPDFSFSAFARGDGTVCTIDAGDVS